MENKPPVLGPGQHGDFRLILEISDEAKAAGDQIMISAAEAIKRLQVLPGYAQSQAERLERQGNSPEPAPINLHDRLLVVLDRLNANAECFLRLVSDVQSQNDYIAVLLVWERIAWQELTGGYPPEVCRPESDVAIRAEQQIKKTIQSWRSKSFQKLAEMDGGEMEAGRHLRKPATLVIDASIAVGIGHPNPAWSQRRRREELLAAYKSATNNPSNRQIYSSRNSGIHKPQFYEWRRGDLPGDSATTKNFERFLRERKPPLPRG